jgi:hypothetical protein
MSRKATKAEYVEACKIYQNHGQSAVYDFAREKGINSWSACGPCEDVTPDCEDGACLVCGSVTE